MVKNLKMILYQSSIYVTKLNSAILDVKALNNLNIFNFKSNDYKIQ